MYVSQFPQSRFWMAGGRRNCKYSWHDFRVNVNAVMDLGNAAFFAVVAYKTLDLLVGRESIWQRDCWDRPLLSLKHSMPIKKMLRRVLNHVPVTEMFGALLL
jgi:hypothetical protein